MDLSTEDRIINNRVKKYRDKMRQFDIDPDDLRQEAKLALFQMKMEPTPTAIATVVDRQFYSIYEKETSQRRGGNQIRDYDYNPNPIVSYPLWEKLSKFLELSEDSKIVVDLLMNAPTELIELLKKEKADLKTSISKYLRKYQNWNSRRLSLFWSSVKKS